MAGDYTRFTFDPRRHYSKVLMQQGRVQLDADFNELVDALDRRRRAETADLVGRTGVPFETPDGFKIAIAGTSITIGRGRMYVDGLLAENHGRGALDADPVLDELRGAAPVPYDRQPYLPTAAEDAPITGPGPHLVYLDVWQREVTAVQAPELVEPAVGIDTATRMQTVWQVRVLKNVGAPVSCATPDAQVPGYEQATSGSAGRLTTAAVAPPAPEDPCAVSGAGGYRGPENRLYRVEVHRGGALGSASFKWSSDNGSFAVAVTDIAGPTLTVERLGRDEAGRLAAGDVVEVTDDRQELAGVPGELRRVDRTDEADGTVTLSGALPAGRFDPADPERHTRLRRWDHPSGPLDGALAVPADGGPVLLEDGVQVSFGAEPATGALQTGDHWVFAARAADGSVETLTRATPRGPRHHFARLAVVAFPATVGDCRPVFRPLTDLDRAAGSCTVVVRPHESLQAAVAALPPEGGRVCLTAGLFALEAPVAIADRHRVVLSGAGPATVLRALHAEAALAFSGCEDVEVRSLRAEGGIAPDATRRHLDGALTFTGCRRVLVTDCTLACPDSPQPGDRAQTCVTFRSQEATEQDGVWIEGNRLEVGAWQTGVLVVDPGRAVVAENRLRMPGPPGNDRAALQGIVVAGLRVGSVQVLDNVVDDAVQGIHVGVSHGDVDGHERAGEVLLSRNVVHALVPAGYERERHGVFVGNARSVHVVDTVATLARIGAAPIGGPTPVEGMRIYGLFGPFLCIRQTSLAGFFPAGITIVAIDSPPVDRMWLVAETMAEGAALGVSAPASVEQERNYPKPPPPPAKVTLAPASAQRTAGVPHVVTATVTDAAGQARPGVIVRFSVTGANAATGSLATNGAGQAVFSYTGTKPGADTVTAFADTNGNGLRDADEPQGTATVNYVPPPPGGPTSLALAPTSAALATGAQHCVTATARNADGAPTPGVSVRFTITGPNATSGAVATDALGQARLCYTGTNAGTDTIVAFADTNANGVRDGAEPQAQQVTASFAAPAPATVPDCESQVLGEATRRITSAGLARGTVTKLAPPPRPQPTQDIPVWVVSPERVVGQTPTAGTSVPRGSAVNLSVRAGWKPKGSGGADI